MYDSSKTLQCSALEKHLTVLPKRNWYKLCLALVYAVS